VAIRRTVIIACILGASAFVYARREGAGAPAGACLPATATLTFTGVPSPLKPARTGVALLANQFGDKATLVDLATGTVTSIPTGDGPHDTAVSSDGRWGVVSNFEPERDHQMLGNLLFVIDLASGRVVRTIDTGELRGLHDVVFRPGFPSRVLVTAQTSRRVLEVDIATGEVVTELDTDGDRSHTLAVSSDGATAFTTNEGTGDISRIDVATGKLLAKFPASINVEGIALAAADRELWAGEQGANAVKVRDAASGAVLAEFSGFRHPVRLVASADGKRVVISDPGCQSVVVADGERRAILKVFDASKINAMVGDLSADGRVAFAANRRWLRGRLLAIDLETGHVLAAHPAGWGADGVDWAAPAAR
jgi:DNA-binding beta-propeller fold protein YncE